MTARIYKPARTAMQSGTAKTKEWVLDFEPEQPRMVEPLMGWTSSGDMKQQVRLPSIPRKRPSPIARQRHRLPGFREQSGERGRAFPTPDNFAYTRRESLDPLTAVRRRFGLNGLRGSRFACGMARCRNSDMNRSSGIGCPSRKP